MEYLVEGLTGLLHLNKEDSLLHNYRIDSFLETLNDENMGYPKVELIYKGKKLVTELDIY